MHSPHPLKSVAHELSPKVTHVSNASALINRHA